MNKKASLNIITVIVITLGFYFAYHLLLQDKYKTSIPSIITHTHHLKLLKHVLVLGLLPIYIAAIVFGIVVLGVYIGSSAQQFIHRFIKKSKPQYKKIQLSDLP